MGVNSISPAHLHARTPHGGCIVRGGELAKSRNRPTRIFLPLCPARRYLAITIKQGRVVVSLKLPKNTAGEATSTTEVADGEWHQLVLSRNAQATTAKLAIDGREQLYVQSQGTTLVLDVDGGGVFIGDVSDPTAKFTKWGPRPEPFNFTPMAVNPVSFGSPHVRPMGCTCGEPGEIKKNTHPKYITALLRD